MAGCGLVVLCFLVGKVAGHGSLADPESRSKEAYVAQPDNALSVRFDEMADGRIAAFYYMNKNCAAEPTLHVWEQNQCLGEDYGFKDGFVVSTTSPGNKVIPASILDCSMSDECANPYSTVLSVLAQPRYEVNNNTSVQTVLSDKILYLTWFGQTHCANESDWKKESLETMKFKLGVCTKLDIHATRRDCENESCYWFSQGCLIGCPKCVVNTTLASDGCPLDKRAEPTIMSPSLRTWDVNNDMTLMWPEMGKPHEDITKAHPWRYPGSAPVMDPCGVAGGSKSENIAAAGLVPAGYEAGDLGSSLPENKRKKIIRAGTTFNVSWRLRVNHGGGYQYRLCGPKGKLLTEECFQEVPLGFYGSTHTLIFKNGTEAAIPATYVSTGTMPTGSMWARVPIPACYHITGGLGDQGCDKPQFEPPAGCDKNCWGYQNFGTRTIPDIQDTLVVPEDLPAGQYVLGWRWDNEQGSQVWGDCSDVIIEPRRLV